MKCEDCGYFYSMGLGDTPTCHFLGDFGAPCQNEGEDNAHYTVTYFGYVFEGDLENAWNHHDTEDFDKAMEIYNAYRPQGLEVYVVDNWYGVSFHDDEWS